MRRPSFHPNPLYGVGATPKKIGFRSSRVKWQATSGCVTRAKILEIRLASEKRSQLLRQGNWENIRFERAFLRVELAACSVCFMGGRRRRSKTTVEEGYDNWTASSWIGWNKQNLSWVPDALSGLHGSCPKCKVVQRHIFWEGVSYDKQHQCRGNPMFHDDFLCKFTLFVRALPITSSFHPDKKLKHRKCSDMSKSRIRVSF